MYKRDDYTCQNCGRKRDSKSNVEIQAHHVVPVSKGGSHDLSNLTTVCADCHNAIHGERMAPTEQSLSDQSSGLSWTKNHNPPQFGTCPNCGCLNSDECSVTIISSNNIKGMFNNKGFIAKCSSCSMELHGTNPGRWKLVNGIEELQGTTLARKQWDRIGTSLRQNKGASELIKEVEKERKDRENKLSVISLVFTIPAIFLFISVDSLTGYFVGIVLLLVGITIAYSAIN